MPTIFYDKVTAGSVTFNDRTAWPATALKFNIDNMPGWKTTPAADAVLSSIGSIDGVTSADEYPIGGRFMTIEGYVLASTRAEAEALEDVLLRDAFPRNAEIELIRYEPTPKRLAVRVIDQRDIVYVTPEGFRFFVPVVAPDPFKYALTSVNDSAGVAGFSTGGRTYPRTYPLEYVTTFSGTENSVVLVNAGTAPTYPVVEIHGPLPKGWHLSNETYGEDLRFDVALNSATDLLVIDFKNEIATLNGFLVTSTISGDFFRIRPGPNTIKLFGNFDPAAGFTITIYSAWE